MIVSDKPATTDAMTAILLNALESLAAHQGLTTREIAARCVLSGKVPTFPAYSKEVVNAYASLETELTRGAGVWSGKGVI